MAIDPLTGSAIIGGVKALGKYAFGRSNRPKYDQTNYAKRLKQIMEQGRLSPGEEGIMKSKVGRTAGNIAQKAASGYTGRLASMGMLDSVAGARGLADIQQKPLNAVTQEQERINLMEGKAKDEAADQYALGKDLYQDRIRELKDKERQELVGGLLDAAGSYAGGKINKAYNKELYGNLDLSNPESVGEFIAKHPNPEQAVNQIYKMSLSSRYTQGNNGLIDAKGIVGIIQNNPDNAAQIITQLAQLGLLSDDLIQKLQ